MVNASHLVTTDTLIYDTAHFSDHLGEKSFGEKTFNISCRLWFRIQATLCFFFVYLKGPYVVQSANITAVLKTYDKVDLSECDNLSKK